MTAIASTSTSHQNGAAAASAAAVPPSTNGNSASVADAANQVSLDEYDEEQVRLMEERCILVTPEDVAYGEGSKKECHLMTNINNGLLHRAFSVFLFRPSDGRLLLQRRADEKITFPSMWTNTCCSHPLAIRGELEEAGEIGVRRAAIRKLPHELGVPEDALAPQDFTFLTKIHYLAPNPDGGLWGEHEVDYILFATKDVELSLNPNEVSEHKYVSAQELKEMFNGPKEQVDQMFTPWFRLICNHLLFPWWQLMMERSKEQGLGKVDAKVLEDQRRQGVQKLV